MCFMECLVVLQCFERRTRMTRHILSYRAIIGALVRVCAVKACFPPIICSVGSARAAEQLRFGSTLRARARTLFCALRKGSKPKTG